MSDRTLTNDQHHIIHNNPDIKSYLLSPEGVRSQAQKIYQLALSGDTHFTVHENKLSDVVKYVLKVITNNYPDKNVPYHSRWRHFEVGNQFQLTKLRNISQPLNEIDRAKLGIDLILPSVLVDAGAGDDWSYSSENSIVAGRSEGLGLASLDLFLSGHLSHRKKTETTAQGLIGITIDQFKQSFKVSDNNPLLGVEGRVQLLQSLGQVIQAQPEIFPNERPGDIVEYIIEKYDHTPTAENILQMVLTLFGDIWPGRLTLDNTNLGDTWEYLPLGTKPDNYVPFHKLSQWITYSIIETLEQCGFTIGHLNKLTGLAEYRNGGLVLDSGLIALRDPANTQQRWRPSSEIIIEWRALTVIMLDKIAHGVTSALNTNPESFPLAKVLEGGTWAAGRKLAMETRNNLNPPLQIISDATVF